MESPLPSRTLVTQSVDPLEASALPWGLGTQTPRPHLGANQSDLVFSQLPSLIDMHLSMSRADADNGRLMGPGGMEESYHHLPEQGWCLGTGNWSPSMFAQASHSCIGVSRVQSGKYPRLIVCRGS